MCEHVSLYTACLDEDGVTSTHLSVDAIRRMDNALRPMRRQQRGARPSEWGRVLLLHTRFPFTSGVDMHRDQRLTRVGMTRSRASISYDIGSNIWTLTPVINGQRVFLGCYFSASGACHAWHVAASLVRQGICPTPGLISDLLSKEL